MANFVTFITSDLGPQTVSFDGMTEVPRKLYVWTPDETDGHVTKPADGWPVYVTNQSTGYASTAVAEAADQFLVVGGGTTLTAVQEPLSAELVKRGVAVVLVDVTGPWFAGDVPTTYHPGRATTSTQISATAPDQLNIAAGDWSSIFEAGDSISVVGGTNAGTYTVESVTATNITTVETTLSTEAAGTSITIGVALAGNGLVHPPGRVLESELGEDAAGGDAWGDVNKLNPFKDFVRGIQWVRDNAATLGINPNKLAVGGSAGSGSNHGSASATIALYAALHEDFADASFTDARRQSSRAIACYAANFQGMWTWYDPARGDMGSTPSASGGSFMMFPHDDSDVSVGIADTFGDVPYGYREEFSPILLAGRTKALRDANASGCRFILESTGFAGTNYGTTSAGTAIAMNDPAWVGADTLYEGKTPSLSGLFDPTHATNASTNRHTPFGPYLLMDRLRQIETGSFHTTNSVLIQDAATRSYASTAGVTTTLADTSADYPNANTSTRIKRIADELCAALFATS